MAIRVALNHKTSYHYAKPVWLSPQVVRLRPAPHCRTPVTSYSMTVKPAEHFVNWQQDPYSNRLARLVFPKKTHEFTVEIDLVAELTVINPFDFFLDKYAEEFPFQYDATLKHELTPYLEVAPAGPKFSEVICKARKDKVRTVDFLVDLNQHLCQNIKYLIRLEPGIQTPEETLTSMSGSCRDSAWLLVHLLRHLGLAARFVSGYLIQLTPDVKSLDGPSGTTVDFTDLHAWAEVYLPGAGWVGFDATSGLMAGEGHLPLACSADPVAAAPITGFFSTDDAELVGVDPEDGAEHGEGSSVKDTFFHSMSVTRIHEDPRVTKPYTDEQWVEIEALGHQVDADLKRSDVRLTMGGEPTFVSIDDMDGPEWTSAAMGPMKYKRGDELLRRIRDRFTTGALLHHGQGKWYPGEPLPRWSFGVYWRKDGQPIWKDYTLVADETKPAGSTENDAHAFGVRLAEKLGIPKRYLVPGFEDVWFYLWKERRLPVNVDPFDAKLEKPEERARLAKIFEQGLDRVVGLRLPLRRIRYTDGTGMWVSGDWLFRPERMYLIPGDSPMGYRLPLDSLAWVAKAEHPHVYELDPWAPRVALPESEAFSRQRYITGSPEAIYPRGRVEQVLAPEIAVGERGDGPERSGEFSDFDEGSLTNVPPFPSGSGIGTAGKRVRNDISPDYRPARGESAPWVVRTALCIEARLGVLRIFMPPVRYFEEYLELLTAIEETAGELKIPVLIEGYTPPHDPRVNQIKVTPDPGVIEVNTLPVESWDELVKNTTALYEERD